MFCREEGSERVDAEDVGSWLLRVLDQCMVRLIACAWISMVRLIVCAGLVWRDAVGMGIGDGEVKS